MRVLISAYACAPGFGSEPEVGFQAVLGAAMDHEVSVLFRADFFEGLSQALERAQLTDRVELHPIDVGGLPASMTRPGNSPASLWRQHVHYERWQRAASRYARSLHEGRPFDLVHHVTVSAYWTLVGAASVDAPLVLGPLGGGVEVPVGLLPVLGVRGLGEYAARTTARRLFSRRPRVRSPLRQAAVVLAQNAETARRMRQNPGVTLHPHTTTIDVAGTSLPSDRNSEIAFCGRLVAWKAGTLAIRTMTHVEHPDATLVIYGTGPDKRRMESEARRLRVAHRVVFASHVPRAELLTKVARSGVYLHPSLHEEGGMAVAEALALGTPVVALAQGGPPVSASFWPASPAMFVEPSRPSVTAARLASAIDSFLDAPPPPPPVPMEPHVPFRTALQVAYDRAMGHTRATE